jgi:putative SOS response-associated peptidase YedK
MCNLYRMTSNADAMRQQFKVNAPTLPDLPVYTEIAPDEGAPIIRDVAGVREIVLMQWGFPSPVPGTSGVTNVRNLSSRFWRAALSSPERRCLVPVTAFSGRAATANLFRRRRQKLWFDLPTRPLFAFAGVWCPTGETDRFAFVTTMPNGYVASAQPKTMPMILAEDEQDFWLGGTFAEVCALSTAYPEANVRVLL